MADTAIITPTQEAVLIEVQEEVSVIALQKEGVTVETRTEAVVITPQQEAVLIEAGQQGPAGPKGDTGEPGIGGILDLDDLQDVNVSFPGDGDIIRYNAATGNWESCAEPFEFRGLILVPMVLPGSPVEGFVAYNIADNGLYVAVE